MILYYLKTWWRWIRRYNYCRGFGVQSPSAYSFIRYVVNEHYPYYAYQELALKLKHLSKREHKMGRLFLRLANFWQPSVCFCDSDAYQAYLKAGCLSAQQKCMAEFLQQESSEPQKQLLVVDLKRLEITDVMRKILPLVSEQTLLVLIGIHQEKETLEKWFALQESAYTGITYDLYYTGIVFFDKSIFKQHYRVNF